MHKRARTMNLPAKVRRLSQSEADDPRPTLIGAGAFEMGPELSRNWHCQRVWLFECFKSGSLEIYTKDRGWRKFETGTAVLYPPQTRFRERLPAGCNQCSSFSLFFDDRGYGPIRERFGRKRQAWHIEDADGLIRRSFTAIEQAMDPGVAADLMIDGCFTQLIAGLLRGEQTERSVVVGSGSPTEPRFITQAHQFMRGHMAKPLQIADIARHVGLSESGFSHAYRRETGSAPMTALRATRVEAVKALMLRSNLSLEHIATQTGFSDAFHLSRTFKDFTGFSPSHYRKSDAHRP